MQLVFCAGVSYGVLTDIMENYTVTGHIGEGAHGLVLRGKHLPTGREVALKKVKVRRLEDGIPISILRESKILQIVDCRYVCISLLRNKTFKTSLAIVHFHDDIFVGCETFGLFPSRLRICVSV